MLAKSHFGNLPKIASRRATQEQITGNPVAPGEMRKAIYQTNGTRRCLTVF